VRAMAKTTQADVIRLLIVQRKARLTERLHNHDYSSGYFADRMDGAVEELDLLLKQVDKYLGGDASALYGDKEMRSQGGAR